MTDRTVITDAMWARIEPWLPSTAPQRGGRWKPHRPIVEAIAWRFRTGAAWRDLPAAFGCWQTVFHRHNAWSKDGTYDRLHQALMGEADAAGELDWLVSIDSTIARAHQHAAGARRHAVDAGDLEVVVDGQGSLKRPIELQESAV